MGRRPLRDSQDSDTDRLLASAQAGDQSAINGLLARHRDSLKRMVAARMDPRLAGRLDPSDVVQDVLVIASQRLPDYLLKRPLPFYPWLRQIGRNHLVDLQREHIRSGKRSVLREQPDLSDQSVMQLADRFEAGSVGPSTRLMQQEQIARIRSALSKLSEGHREVLILRHLEQLSTKQTAQVLGTSEAAIKMRQLRAMQNLRSMLEDQEQL